jgi:hypothetical protein
MSDKLNSGRRLRELLPPEFRGGGYETVSSRTYTPDDKPSPVGKLLDEIVEREHSRPHDDEAYVEWPGKHKDVHVWWELRNGKGVAWNENPSKGWSFPVMIVNHLKKWNGRGDYSDLKGTICVCAKTKKEAVELITKTGHRHMTMREFTEYYSECWPYCMDSITPKVGVWILREIDGQETAERLI